MFYVAADVEEEVHSRYESCCSALFHPEPIFTWAGTCYSTKKKMLEQFPSTANAIKFWMRIDDDDSPGTYINMLVHLSNLCPKCDCLFQCTTFCGKDPTPRTAEACTGPSATLTTRGRCS